MVPFSYNYQFVKTDGESMSPTFEDGELMTHSNKIDYVRDGDKSWADYLYLYDPSKKTWSHTAPPYPSDYKPETAKWFTGMTTKGEGKYGYQEGEFDEEIDRRDKEAEIRIKGKEAITPDRATGVTVFGVIGGMLIGIFLGKNM